MRKLVVVIGFAAVALAAQSAAACDWNRDASTGQSTVASTAAPIQTPQTTSTAPQTASVASESAKPVEPTAPVVLVHDRH